MACGPEMVARGARFRSCDGRSEYRGSLRLRRRWRQHGGRLDGKPLLCGKGHPVHEQLHRKCARAMTATGFFAMAIFLLPICGRRPVLRLAPLDGDRRSPRVMMRKSVRYHIIGLTSHAGRHLAGLPQRRPAVEAERHDQQETQCESGPSHEPETLNPRGVPTLIPRQNLACQ